MRLTGLHLQALGLFFVPSSPQRVTYKTYAVTQCLTLVPPTPDSNGAGSSGPNANPNGVGPSGSNPNGPGAGSPGPNGANPTKNNTPPPLPTERLPPGTITYSMPPCVSCNCPTCTLTSVYTTTYSRFCPSGLTDQAYTITETYVGMSSLPGFAEPTRVPFGFTTGVATCDYCGTTGRGGETDGGIIVATLTYPSNSDLGQWKVGGNDGIDDGMMTTQGPSQAADATTIATTSGVMVMGGGDGMGADADGASGDGVNRTESTLSTSWRGSVGVEATATIPVYTAGVVDWGRCRALIAAWTTLLTIVIEALA
ncbi:hypothetical protein F4778DRAFT_546075 [Xylariomycetidae sp. FL2044]|nr:hypothetical protein F4778DRAFT_546075 [Xylariomycetidae sp. FL2044]